VPVGPADEGGVAAGVVAEGGLLGPAAREEQAAVEGVLGHVDPGEHGGGGAHGVPPLSITDAGSHSPGVARGVASEVEERRRPGRTLVPEVGASSAACGWSGRRARSDTDGSVTYDPLQQTAGA
jgi:hypothetical protein